MEVTDLGALSADRRNRLLNRDAGITEITDDVADIIDAVREDGDAALRRFAREFDDVDKDHLEITDRLPAARDAVDPRVEAAIEAAAANIRAFHESQVPTDQVQDIDGRRLGQRFRPIDRVGVYVPGGDAAYPSSALMGVIPAVVAGVEEVVVATPPATDPDPATLTAIDVAGADAVYGVGGAQAVAALAYGTDTIAPVEKIVGPGNRWVTAAKAAVRNDVAIDFLAGPSEILVIADDTATPAYVAADLIAQAEHDPNASAVAVLTDDSTAAAVTEAVEDQLPDRDRADVARTALGRPASGVFTAADRGEAAAFAEAYAPEHLAVQTRDPDDIVDRVPSAGSVFVGETTPVAAGDYATGPNHVLPTGGGARVTGGLSVDTFLRATTVQRVDRDALASLREPVTTLAREEGLEAHAASIDVRFDDEGTHHQD
ncbi:MAG: histidinol dehydrogenase [Halobacteriaceae archaeon]